MRVLLVNMTLDIESGGGTARKTAQVARALQQAGDEVVVLTFSPVPVAVRAAMDGIGIVALPPLNRRFWIPVPRLRQIAATVATADAVVIGNHWMILNVLVARAARRLGRPYVVIPSGALPVEGRSRWMKHLFNRLYGRRLIREAAAWVATTGQEAGDFGAYGIDPERVQIIPNAIDPEIAPEAKSLPVPLVVTEKPFLLFVGRLMHEKGPDLLLEAFAGIARRVPHDLVFFGAGPLLRSLRAQAAAAGLSARIHFRGFVAPLALPAAYAEADLVVIPSRRDAMTLVVLEAGLAGRPVLITDRCGADDLAAAEAVVVVPPDPRAIGKGILEILGRDDGGRALGRHLQEVVTRDYALNAAGTQYRMLLHGLVGEGL